MKAANRIGDMSRHMTKSVDVLLTDFCKKFDVRRDVALAVLGAVVDVLIEDNFNRGREN